VSSSVDVDQLVRRREAIDSIVIRETFGAIRTEPASPPTHGRRTSQEPPGAKLGEG
jgi:hypothetical protein